MPNAVHGTTVGKIHARLFMSGQYSCFVLVKSAVRITASRPAILPEGFRGSSQSL